MSGSKRDPGGEMMRTFTVAALAVLMIPAAASPQGTPRRPSTQPRVRVETGPGSVFAYSENRGRIGVVVDTRADATGDKVGARIDGVTPGGPAEKASLKARYVITRFNGMALRGAARAKAETPGPGTKLRDVVPSTETGHTAP